MKPLPMLAMKAAPFDAEDYLFEVKCALAAVEVLRSPNLIWFRAGPNSSGRVASPSDTSAACRCPV